MGKFPSTGLLEKYSLQEEYGPILTAIKIGDVAAYETALMEAQALFIKKGMLIMMENLRIIAYRNLFKKTWIALGKTSRIKLAWFETAMNLRKVKITMPEIECFFANLVYKEWVKGYISAEHAMVVLSNTEPFPKISS